MIRLGQLTARDDFRRAVEVTLRASLAWMERASLGVGQLLLGLGAWLANRRTVAVE